MNPFLVKSLQKLVPAALWHVQTDRKEVYLTFDDGPISDVTDFVLDELEHYGAQATFFCLGKNALDQPELMRRMKLEGHTIGHHTFEHTNGWKTDTETYFREVQRGAAITGGKVFRPPYGRMTPAQAKKISAHYNIVMWDVLSKDYDVKLDGEACFKRVQQMTRPGSIIVFHDSVKAWPRLQECLPATLSWLKEEGYEMKALKPSSEQI